MAGLKVLRNLVGIPWIAVFIWGIVSLFRGDWAGLGIAVVIWIILGIIFGAIHGALQRAEVQAANTHMSETAFAVSVGDWNGALAASSRSVQIMRASFTRDRGQKEMQGPYAITLLGHALLLGAVGRFDEAQSTLDQSVPMLRNFRSAMPGLDELVAAAEELQDSYPTVGEYQIAARAFHSFI